MDERRKTERDNYRYIHVQRGRPTERRIDRVTKGKLSNDQKRGDRPRDNSARFDVSLESWQ